MIVFDHSKTEERADSQAELALVNSVPLTPFERAIRSSLTFEARARQTQAGDPTLIDTSDPTNNT